MDILSKKEQLIFAILFSKTCEFDIDHDEYCVQHNRSEFREEIRNIIKKGGISIVDDKITHRDEKIIWKIEIKKQITNK